MKKKLTYANVISGSNQLKKNAVTTAKLKNGAVTGSKLNLTTLGTVPSATNAGHASTADNATNAGHAKTADSATSAGHATAADSATAAGNSATTSVVKSSPGTLTVGQTATIMQYGPLAITAECKEIAAGHIGEQFLISSSTPGSAFATWQDGSAELGPETEVEEREINNINWADSTGEYEYDGPADANLSASASGGQAFNAIMGEATEEDSNTCWYWLTANIAG
jgi:hypothetical protein